GSAGIDIPTANRVTINSHDVVKVPLQAWGPIGKGLSALLIGISSATLMGLNVHVGVIDADYTGQICAMISTNYPPVTIPKGTCLAQIVPFLSCVPKTENQLRSTGGFGSTGTPQVCWAQRVTAQRPTLTCTLTSENARPRQIKVNGLLDMGADITIVS
ncbi:POK9 protein, partial [Loxia curvirostra]|nr:POK9 protein [Loxia curvirostra]